MSSVKGGQLEGIHFFKNGKLFLSRKERLCLAYFFPLLVSLNEGVAYFKERGYGFTDLDRNIRCI